MSNHPFPHTIQDRLRHLLVVGKTGTGKTTFLRNLCGGDVRDGHGVLVIDPHGDLVEQLRGDIPRRRKNDVILFDAAAPDTCPGLNPLASVSPGKRSLVVSGIISALRKTWSDSWGPRTEHLLRYALLALTEVRGATIHDAQRMLVDPARRAWVLKQVTDDIVRAFWAQEFPGYGRELSAQAAAPVLNKLGALLASQGLRTIVTRRRPVVDMGKCLHRGSIVLGALPKGVIGEDVALLLGGLLLGALQHATMGRAVVPPEKRQPFLTYVDEVGSFATQPFVELVAEARKFGVGLVLAAQSLASMDPTLRAGLLGNVGTLVTFRVGGEDAEILQRELIGRFGPATLMKLGLGEMVVRTGSGDARIFQTPP